MLDMNGPVFNIERVENLHIGSGVQLGGVMDEVARGASPEALRDMGHDVPEDVDTPTLVAETPIEEDLDRLESLEEQSRQDAVNANSRRNYLFQLIKEVGRQRKMEGFSANHERLPDDRATVEDRNYDVQKQAKVTLGRACGVCALASTCAIREDLGAWVSTHPYANSDRKRIYTSRRDPKVKRTESRMKFLDRLDEDPMAHCIPPKAKK
jgi:hypothetical protein